MTLRVLFLTESFHPVLGGGEQHIRRLGSALSAGGGEVTVLTRRGDPAWPGAETLDGVRVVRVPPAGPGRRGKYLMVPAALAALFRLRRSYDIVVVRGTRVLALPALLFARALGKRVVLQAEVNGEMSGEVYTWGTALDRGLARRLVGAVTAARNRLLRDADAFVAMSRAIQREFLGAGLAPEKIALLPHGVDVARFRPASVEERAALRARLSIGPEWCVIVYTGRLLRGKGLLELVDAFARVRAEHPHAHLMIVGSGDGQALSVEDALRERVGAAGLQEAVTFTGRVDAVEDYLRASDVFVFPSVFEALGLSLVEAAACGLPAVASRTGGIVDVVEDTRSGLLVPPADVAGLAAALSTLVSDPGLRRAMGEAAREVATTRFDERDALSAYRALFQEVAGRGRLRLAVPAGAPRG